MAKRHRAEIVHCVPGRVRLRLPAARDRAEHLAQVQREFASQVGVRELSVNPLTASIVVAHDPGLDALALCRSVPCLDLVLPPARRAEADFLTRLHNVDSSIRYVSGDRLDLVTLVMTVLSITLKSHPAGQVVEIVAELVLQALFGHLLASGGRRSAPLLLASSEPPLLLAA